MRQSKVRRLSVLAKNDGVTAVKRNLIKKKSPPENRQGFK